MQVHCCSNRSICALLEGLAGEQTLEDLADMGTALPPGQHQACEGGSKAPCQSDDDPCRGNITAAAETGTRSTHERQQLVQLVRPQGCIPQHYKELATAYSIMSMPVPAECHYDKLCGNILVLNVHPVLVRLKARVLTHPEVGQAEDTSRQGQKRPAGTESKHRCSKETISESSCISCLLLQAAQVSGHVCMRALKPNGTLKNSNKCTAVVICGAGAVNT